MICADVGTSSSQWDDGINFSDEPDVCRGNVVRDNLIKTNVRSNEMVLQYVSLTAL